MGLISDLTKEPTGAAHHFRRAADQGHPGAQYRLGVILEQGKSVPRDVERATALYEKAAVQGHVKAQSSLKRRRAEEKRTEGYIQKAKQGDADAQYAVSLIYVRGLVVAQDTVKAIDWAVKAAAQGHALALQMVGQMYQSGYGGTSINHSLALSYFRKSARQGNDYAFLLIAEIYYDSGDWTEALDLLYKAKQSDDRSVYKRAVKKIRSIQQSRADSRRAKARAAARSQASGVNNCMNASDLYCDPGFQQQMDHIISGTPGW